MSKQAVSGWERGDAAPSYESVKTVFTPLGISADWVLTGDGEMLGSGATRGVGEPRATYAPQDPSEYAHLVPAGSTFTYALRTGDGRVKAAVKIVMMLDPDTDSDTLSLDGPGGA